MTDVYKRQQLVSEAFSEIERKAVEGISKEEMEGFLSVDVYKRQ